MVCIRAANYRLVQNLPNYSRLKRHDSVLTGLLCGPILFDERFDAHSPCMARPCRCPATTVPGRFFMTMTRVVAFIDGFNLYHAVADLKRPHLKWLNLWKLSEQFTGPPPFSLNAVHYFSAYATWRRAAYARHREYVKALRAVGVNTIMAIFKEKEYSCHKCNHRWTGHEEKESDVSIALYLYAKAVQDEYDRALLISGDSDIAPAIELLMKAFPEKTVRIINPVGRKYSSRLYQMVGRKNYRPMKEIHVARSLFDAQVFASDGTVAAVRPPEYAPPV